MATIAGLAAAAAAIGSWIIPVVVAGTDKEARSYVLIFFAPASGLVGGIVVGYVTVWRRAGLRGLTAAVGGFAAAAVVAWVASPGKPADADYLPWIAIGGAAFLVGWLLGAVAAAFWERPGGAASALEFFSSLFGYGRRW